MNLKNRTDKWNREDKPKEPAQEYQPEHYVGTNLKTKKSFQ